MSCLGKTLKPDGMRCIKWALKPNPNVTYLVRGAVTGSLNRLLPGDPEGRDVIVGDLPGFLDLLRIERDRVCSHMHLTEHRINVTLFGKRTGNTH